MAEEGSEDTIPSELTTKKDTPLPHTPFLLEPGSRICAEAYPETGEVNGKMYYDWTWVATRPDGQIILKRRIGYDKEQKAIYSEKAFLPSELENKNLPTTPSQVEQFDVDKEYEYYTNTIDKSEATNTVLSKLANLISRLPEEVEFRSEKIKPNDLSRGLVELKPRSVYGIKEKYQRLIQLATGTAQQKSPRTN